MICSFDCLDDVRLLCWWSIPCVWGNGVDGWHLPDFILCGYSEMCDYKNQQMKMTGTNDKGGSIGEIIKIWIESNRHNICRAFSWTPWVVHSCEDNSCYHHSTPLLTQTFTFTPILPHHSSSHSFLPIFIYSWKRRRNPNKVSKATTQFRFATRCTHHRVGIRLVHDLLPTHVWHTV